MVAQLREMKFVLIGDEDGPDHNIEEELKQMDPFQKKKRELNLLLREVREGIVKLEGMNKELGSARDATSIRVLTSNQQRITEACNVWKELKNIIITAEKKGGKIQRGKVLTPEEISFCKSQAALLQHEIQDLSLRNARVKPVHTAGDLAIQARLKANAETAERAKIDKARQAREARNSDRRNRRNRRDGDSSEMEGLTNGAGIDGLSEPVYVAREHSAEEQLFYDQVQANKEEQDEMMIELAKGLDELKDLGEGMNKNLELQNEMAASLTIKMEQGNLKVAQADKQLKEVLAQSGGCVRWCPLLVCTVLLLALVGYIMNLV